jgi:hypothetical protein
MDNPAKENIHSLLASYLFEEYNDDVKEELTDRIAGQCDDPAAVIEVKFIDDTGIHVLVTEYGTQEFEFIVSQDEVDWDHQLNMESMEDDNET